MVEILRMERPARGRNDLRKADFMDAAGRLSLEDELIGMAVVINPTSTRLGKVSDALVNPTNGTVIALSVRAAEGDQEWLATGNFHLDRIDHNTVLTAETGALNQKDFRECQDAAAYACRELIGAKVVTEEGKLLGRVTGVQISAEDAKFFYRVAPSRIEQMLRGGFLMAGDAPLAYFPSGLRLIVPASLESIQKNRSRAGLPGFSFGAGHTLQIVRDFVNHYGVLSLFIIQMILVLWLLFA